MIKGKKKLQKKLINVTIDTSVLAVPQVDSDKEDAEKYVKALLDWSQRLKNNPWLGMYKSEKTDEILYADGQFPRQQLESLFATHGIPQYDFNTVMRQVDRFLNRILSFEEEFQIEDVLLDPFETSPDINCLITRHNLQSKLERMIALISILNKFCHGTLGKHLLILRDIPMKVNRIHVTACIQILEHNRDDIDIRTPESFESCVLVCDDFQGLVEHLDESKALTNAADDDEIKLAVQIALFKYNQGHDNITNWDNEELPHIGSEFREKCQQVCRKEERGIPKKILRSIVEAVTHENLDERHRLKTGSGANDPQKVRQSDNAKAWRRVIGQGKTPLRLHYWQRTDNTIELASVNHNHDDYSIPE